MTRAFLLAGLLAVVATVVAAADQTPPAALVVSVAASMSDVISGLGPAWERTGQAAIRVNTGGSNTIARQIVEGAGVDVFVSADDRQMDVVERAGRLVSGTRVALVGNQLVVVAPKDAGVVPSTAAALAAAPVRRVAMGQPDSVPAGVYAREWLERVGLWAQVQPKVVPLPTVRAALAAAREGRVDAAIVYASDARSEPGVVTAFVVTGKDAPAIVFPAAVVRGAHEEAARRFLAFLQGPEARRAFVAAGFTPLVQP